jgi:hypothetical protein
MTRMMQGPASKPGTLAPSSSAHSSQQQADAARSHRDALLAPPLRTPGAPMQSQGPPALQPGSLVDVALAGRLFMGPGFPQTTRASITRILNEQSFEVCVCVRACVRMCLCAVVSCACTLVRARTHMCAASPQAAVRARGSWVPCPQLPASCSSMPCALPDPFYVDASDVVNRPLRPRGASSLEACG